MEETKKKVEKRMREDGEEEEERGWSWGETKSSCLVLFGLLACLQGCSCTDWNSFK